MSDYAEILMGDPKTKQFLESAADFYQHNFFVLHPNFDYCHKEGKEKWNEDKIRTYHILKQSETLGVMQGTFLSVKDLIQSELKEKRISTAEPILEAARGRIRELALEDIRQYLATAEKKVDPKTFEESFRFYFSRDIGNHLAKTYDQETKFIRHLAQQQVREAEALFR